MPRGDLLKDETCWFLAIDFDKSCWQEIAQGIARFFCVTR